MLCILNGVNNGNDSCNNFLFIHTNATYLIASSFCFCLLLLPTIASYPFRVCLRAVCSQQMRFECRSQKKKSEGRASESKKKRNSPVNIERLLIVNVGTRWNCASSFYAAHFLFFLSLTISKIRFVFASLATKNYTIGLCTTTTIITTTIECSCAAYAQEEI